MNRTGMFGGSGVPASGGVPLLESSGLASSASSGLLRVPRPWNGCDHESEGRGASAQRGVRSLAQQGGPSHAHRRGSSLLQRQPLACHRATVRRLPRLYHHLGLAGQPAMGAWRRLGRPQSDRAVSQVRTGHRVPTRTRRLSRDSPIRPRCRGSRHVWCTTSCPRMESPARREPHDVGVHPRRRTRLHHR